MYEQLSSLIFFITILGLTIIDKRRLDSIYTPFTVTAWPFAIITILVNFIVYHLGFYMITVRANYFILLNVLLLWLVGYILYYFFPMRQEKVDYGEVFNSFYRYKYFLLILSWIIILVTFNRIISLISTHGGWWYIGTEEFEEKLKYGLYAHVVMTGRVCFILLYCISLKAERKLIIYSTLTILAITIFLNQVKAHLIFITFICFFISNLQQPITRQIKRILMIGLFFIILFFLFQIIVSFGWQSRYTIADKEVWDYFYMQFINYFVSGPIVLDRWLNLDSIKPDWTLFIVFLNFINVITGNPDRINALHHSTHGFIHVTKSKVSNIGTSYGAYFMIGGLEFTLLCTIILAVISYIIYFKGNRTSSPILIFLNALFFTLNSLSFFGQYFNLSTIYELTFSFIFFILIFKSINIIYNTKREK